MKNTFAIPTIVAGKGVTGGASPAGDGSSVDLTNYVTTNTTQSITGLKNFTKGLKVSGKQVLNITETDNLSIGSQDFDADIFSKSNPTITRGGTTYQNIDDGNFSIELAEHIDGSTIEMNENGKLVAKTATSTLASDLYGIKGDYSTHYGIVNSQTGLLKYTGGEKRITVPAGMRLLMPGTTEANTDKITQVTSDTPYDIISNENVTIFYSDIAKDNVIEAFEVFYQVEEPKNLATILDGVYTAWFNPETDIWKFKTNNGSWIESKATPIADVCIAGNETGTSFGITRIDYIGYRVLNNQLLQKKLIAGDGITLTDNTDGTTLIKAEVGNSPITAAVTSINGQEGQVTLDGSNINATCAVKGQTATINSWVDSIYNDIDTIIDTTGIATSDKKGVVQPDNSTITVNSSGVISATLPTNVVTTDTTQTISGAKKFSTFQNTSGYTVYSYSNLKNVFGTPEQGTVINGNRMTGVEIYRGGETYTNIDSGNIGDYAGGGSGDDVVTLDTDQTINAVKDFSADIKVGTINNRYTEEPMLWYTSGNIGLGSTEASLTLNCSDDPTINIGYRNYDIITSKNIDTYLDNKTSIPKIVVLSQKEYDSLKEVDPSTFYAIEE